MLFGLPINKNWKKDNKIYVVGIDICYPLVMELPQCGLCRYFNVGTYIMGA